MSRVLYCSNVLNRSSNGFRSIGLGFEHSLRREFHFRVLCQEPLLSPLKLLSSTTSRGSGLIANLYTSPVFASFDDPRQRRQEEDNSDDFEIPQGPPKAEREPQVDREGESIIQRLRLLSETPAHEYRLSPEAEEKAREMSKMRSDMRQWDQKNLRPGGPPPQNRRSYFQVEPRRNWEDEPRTRRFVDSRNYEYVDEDDEEEYYNRPSSPYQDSGQRLGGYKPRQDDDGPADHEIEMQRLRERMAKVKEEKAKVQESINAKKQNKPADSEGSSGTSLAAYAHYISSSDKRTQKPPSAPPQPQPPLAPSLGNDYEEIPVHEGNMNLEFAASDPDTFGNLSVGSTSILVKDTVGLAIQAELQEDAKELSEVNDEEDDEEEDDTRFIPPHGERWTSRKLIRKVRELLKEKKLKEAIDTFLNVLKEGGFNFDHKEIRHHFNVLIKSCGDVGYVDMAFLLINTMKKRGYKEKITTYSSLLNAIANSPWDKEKNLERIDKLLILMKERGFEPNKITFHAVIKAYGRHGETLRAFAVVDHMIQEAKYNPNTETFNMLLQACISDKKNGFRHALITWKKLLAMKYIKPDIYTFNLLLRAIRDCGIELHVDQEKISKIPYDQLESGPVLPAVVTDEDSTRLLGYLVQEKPPAEVSQLVLDGLGEPEIINVKALKEALKHAHNRLAVVGGLRGFLSRMAQHKVDPNLKTISQLLECSRGPELMDIVHLIKAYKIKADIDFYNIAIARCYNTHENGLAKEFLKLLIAHDRTPNIVTYGALALGCRSKAAAQKLLEEMDETKYTPNIEVMLSFLKSAMRCYNPMLALYIMEELKRREMPATPAFLDMLQQFRARLQRGIVSKEMGKPVEPKELGVILEKYPDLPEQFAIFKMRFKPWLEKVNVKVDPENPWAEEIRHFRKERRHINYHKEDEVDKLIAEKMGIKMPKVQVSQ